MVDTQAGVTAGNAVACGVTTIALPQDGSSFVEVSWMTGALFAELDSGIATFLRGINPGGHKAEIRPGAIPDTIAGTKR